MLNILVVEDNPRLQPALVQGLEETGAVRVAAACDTGEQALEVCRAQNDGHDEDSSARTGAGIQAILMDVQLASSLNGIQTAILIRREFPRMPVVFYSIQDDDEYFRQFRASGILSHYAYVRKSSYLLPRMIVPLLEDAARGKSFIEPEIEARVQEVGSQIERGSPLDLLEPNERQAALLLAAGLSNRQIADRLGFRDKRTIARVNGQIYSTWGLNENADDEKVARTRAALIVHTGRMIQWDDDGTPSVQDASGEWVDWQVGG